MELLVIATFAFFIGTLVYVALHTNSEIVK